MGGHGPGMPPVAPGLVPDSHHRDRNKVGSQFDIRTGDALLRSREITLTKRLSAVEAEYFTICAHPV